MDKSASSKNDYHMICIEETKKKYKSKKMLSKLYNLLKDEEWTYYMTIKR